MKPAESTRRDFLKKSAGLTALGAAVPYFWTSATARGGDAETEQVTMAAIGLGIRGADIGNQAADRARMVACADLRRCRAEEFAGLFGGQCEVYSDYRKVLDRKDVQAITCATPPHWHTKIAVDAMRAGKDVYCEKPLTLTMAETKLICDVVRETGRVFQVGTQQRSEYNNVFLEAIAIAQSGRLGQKLRAVAAMGPGQSGGPFPPQPAPPDLNWDFWLGQAPAVPFAKKRFVREGHYWFEYSGGEIPDWGVHHVDIALWALGAEKTGVLEVEGKGDFPLGRELTLETLLGKKPFRALPCCYNTATNYDCTMRLPNGNAIELNSRGRYELFIEGERGHLAVNRGGLHGGLVDKLKKDPAQKQWLDEAVRKLYGNKPMRGHMANFLDCVRDRSLPISDVFTHAHTINACHMCNMAMLLGHKIRWDPQRQQFIGDADVDALMTRRQRPPYTITA